jgi:hypothetical protein
VDFFFIDDLELAPSAAKPGYDIAIQFRTEPGTILTRRFEEATSLRLTRGIQLDLGDRAKRCLSEDPAPWLIQPCRR